MKLDNLFKKMHETNRDYRKEIATLLAAKWEDWQELQKAIQDLQSGEKVEYCMGEDGIYACLDFAVNKIELRERSFFKDYLADYSVAYNFDCDRLESYQGDDNYIVQDDTSRDNGVWVGHKCVFKEAEYAAKYLNQTLDEDEQEYSEDEDDKRRNALIEARMEKEGYFPGVFRVTSRGDVFPINTQETK